MLAGETFSQDNVRAIRPGLGLAPKHIDAVLGRKARHALRRGTALGWDIVE
jgi:N-acetylneuraminate synthase